MARYIGLIDGTAGAYGIIFPDFPGWTSMGDTIEQVIGNGADAMRLWAQAAREDGIAVPEPRAFDAMRDDPEVTDALNEGATVATVPLVYESGRPAKANLSIDHGVLDAIDAEARRRKLTRSAFIEAMAREMLWKMS